MSFLWRDPAALLCWCMLRVFYRMPVGPARSRLVTLMLRVDRFAHPDNYGD